jgi:UDP-GlcNAc:undecaprenyl-phosphate GlcNAc-1-phosphate transferase
MREYGLTLLVAAAVTYLLTPLVRRVAIAVGALHAARDRDVHVQPTPLLGGFAMYGGLAAGLLVAYQLSHLSTVFAGTKLASGLLLAGGLVVVMGFVDDRWGMSAISKLAGQVAAGVILVWSGAVVAWLPVPFGGTLSLTSDEQTALTVLVVVVTINAVNFIDGLDGLATGVVGIGAAAFFVYYYTLTKRLGLDEQTGPALASAILAGVCLGFLPHNFYPARIFMGDTGAMLLGLMLAYAPISSLASLDPSSLTAPAAYGGGTVNRFPEILPLLLPAAILLIPYADLLMAVVRRTRAGQSPFAADKKHLHHRLLDIGHSHRKSVMIMYLWAALFSGTVVLLSIMRTRLLVLAIVTVAGVLVLLLASMPRLRFWTHRPARMRVIPEVASAPPVRAGSGGAPVRSAVADAARGRRPTGPVPGPARNPGAAGVPRLARTPGSADPAAGPSAPAGAPVGGPAPGLGPAGPVTRSPLGGPPLDGAPLDGAPLDGAPLSGSQVAGLPGPAGASAGRPGRTEQSAWSPWQSR